MIKCTLEPSLLERRPLTITQKGNEKRMSYLTFMVSESPKTMNDFLTKESKHWRLLKSLGSQLSSFGYKSALFESPSPSFYLISYFHLTSVWFSSLSTHWPNYWDIVCFEVCFRHLTTNLKANLNFVSSKFFHLRLRKYGPHKSKSTKVNVGILIHQIGLQKF